MISLLFSSSIVDKETLISFHSEFTLFLSKVESFANIVLATILLFYAICVIAWFYYKSN